MDKFKQRKSDEEIFKIIDSEKQGKIKSSKKLNAEYGSFEALKFLPFGFSLGLDIKREISFSGNCYKWSNAFKSNPEEFENAFKIINYFEVITKQQQNKIKELLLKYPNKLFFTKQREGLMKLEWHYYLKGEYRNCMEIPYKDCSELNGVLR